MRQLADSPRLAECTAAGTLTVRRATRAQDKALVPLLEKLNRMRTVFPGTQLRLVFEMLPSDRPGRIDDPRRPSAPTPPVAPPKMNRYAEVCACTPDPTVSTTSPYYRAAPAVLFRQHAISSQSPSIPLLQQ